MLCIGTDPSFLMTVEKGAAQFDYLGDGTFELLPPIDETEALRGTRSHVLLTAQSRIPMVITPGACPVLSLSAPLRIELSVDTSAGPAIFQGCCLLQP